MLDAKDALTWAGGIIGGVIALLTGANTVLRGRTGQKLEDAKNIASISVSEAGAMTIRSLANQVNSLERRLSRLRTDFDAEREARIAAEDGEAAAVRELRQIRDDLIDAKRRMDFQDNEAAKLRARVLILEEQLRKLGHEPIRG